ncbi:MAG: PilZ domain-containing protein [Geothrix sp.]|uniref:PilZ domain-containing protein n=1 Tax=Geothrix sp. TaxID=1962974 RepID=UPI0017AC5E47|nr:PilZ domain-containing protein [Geothrix sp.]NWJ39517.1 PilZ domain-containing protein [Geothrix sp.]WIL19262.1 MAG: PilZ domain-containing protein [Geothrix sp.]
MTHPPEQRRYRRVPIAYEVKLIVEERMISFPSAIDLSLGGILVDGRSPLPVGTNCGVAILLGAGSPGKRIVTRGMVVRADDRGIAIAFSKTLDPGSVESLKALIHSLDPGAEEPCGPPEHPAPPRPGLRNP